MNNFTFIVLSGDTEEDLKKFFLFGELPVVGDKLELFVTEVNDDNIHIQLKVEDKLN